MSLPCCSGRTHPVMSVSSSASTLCWNKADPFHASRTAARFSVCLSSLAQLSGALHTESSRCQVHRPLARAKQDTQKQWKKSILEFSKEVPLTLPSETKHLRFLVMFMYKQRVKCFACGLRREISCYYSHGQFIVFGKSSQDALGFLGSHSCEKVASALLLKGKNEEF